MPAITNIEHKGPYCVAWVMTANGRRAFSTQREDHSSKRKTESAARAGLRKHYGQQARDAGRDA